MGNESALAIQPIARAPSLNAHSDENLIKAIAAGDQGAMRTLTHGTVFAFFALSHVLSPNPVALRTW